MKLTLSVAVGAHGRFKAIHENNLLGPAALTEPHSPPAIQHRPRSADEPHPHVDDLVDDYISVRRVDRQLKLGSVLPSHGRCP
jgi:hypothetical protein